MDILTYTVGQIYDDRNEPTFLKCTPFKGSFLVSGPMGRFGNHFLGEIYGLVKCDDLVTDHTVDGSEIRRSPVEVGS